MFWKRLREDSELAIITAFAGSICLAMLDLDHFKRINDELGHEAGDEVLIDFAKLLMLHTRKADRCFRFGGEEFVLLIPIPNEAALAEIDPSLRRRRPVPGQGRRPELHRDRLRRQPGRRLGFSCRGRRTSGRSC